MATLTLPTTPAIDPTLEAVLELSALEAMILDAFWTGDES